jgi:hypothetical protein
MPARGRPGNRIQAFARCRAVLTFALRSRQSGMTEQGILLMHLRILDRVSGDRDRRPASIRLGVSLERTLAGGTDGKTKSFTTGFRLAHEPAQAGRRNASQTSRRYRNSIRKDHLVEWRTSSAQRTPRRKPNKGQESRAEVPKSIRRDLGRSRGATSLACCRGGKKLENFLIGKSARKGWKKTSQSASLVRWRLSQDLIRHV